MEVTRLEGKLGREQLFMHEGTKSRSKRIIQSSYGCTSKAIRGVGVWLYTPYVQNRVHRCPARMTSVYAIVVYMAVLNFGSLILAPNKLAWGVGLVIQPGGDMRKKRKRGLNYNKVGIMPSSLKQTFSWQLYLSRMPRIVSCHRARCKSNIPPTGYQADPRRVVFVE
ncbi:hypothetical protein F5141DRAFT_1069184 [Pisolithus sp. B1]|nr:hypothetical protein F5141DRAFT_1069184 [Pisolithus sp. B1]